MTDLKLLLGEIENLRDELIMLIDDKDNLMHPEVIRANRNLNEIIAKYHADGQKKKHLFNLDLLL